MTREETIKLLQFLKGCYPYVKLEDPKGMIDAWQLAFYTEEAQDVYKAARLHMSKNKFFPTPADIKEGMNRAKLMYDIASPVSLQAQNNPQLPSGIDDEIESLWDWIVEDHKKGLYKVEQKSII